MLKETLVERTNQQVCGREGLEQRRQIRGRRAPCLSKCGPRRSDVTLPWLETQALRPTPVSSIRIRVLTKALR